MGITLVPSTCFIHEVKGLRLYGKGTSQSFSYMVKGLQ